MQSFPGAQWPPPLPPGMLPPFLPPPPPPTGPPFLVPPNHHLMPAQCNPFPAAMTPFHSAVAGPAAEPVLGPNRSLPAMMPRWAAQAPPGGIGASSLQSESSLLNSNAPEFKPSASAAATCAAHFTDVNLSGCSARSEPVGCSGAPSAESDLFPARFSGPFSLRTAAPIQQDSSGPPPSVPELPLPTDVLMHYLFADPGASASLDRAASTAAPSFSLSQQSLRPMAASNAQQPAVAAAEQSSSSGEAAEASDAPLDLDSLCLAVTRAGLGISTLHMCTICSDSDTCV